MSASKHDSELAKIKVKPKKVIADGEEVEAKSHTRFAFSFVVQYYATVTFFV